VPLIPKVASAFAGEDERISDAGLRQYNYHWNHMRQFLIVRCRSAACSVNRLRSRANGIH
jgi:hypothetical protein